MKNYYKVLQISQDASIEVIHAAYKAMSKKYHPDLYEGDKAEASVKMQEINEAYEVLSDVNRRKAFDDELNSFIRQKKVRVVGASVNENVSNSTNAGMNNNTSTNAASNANTSSYYNNYAKQNTTSAPNPNPTPPPPANIQNPQGNKKNSARGCGCIIAIIIIVIGIVIFINRKTFFGGDNIESSTSASGTSMSSDNNNNVSESSTPVISTSISSNDHDTGIASESSTTANNAAVLPDSHDNENIINTISTYMDAKISMPPAQENDIARECTTQKFADYNAENSGNFEMKTDWAENIITILDIYSSTYKIEAFVEFNSSTLTELLNNAVSNINYEITDVRIDGDNASATVKMQSTDFPALIVATANEVQKDTKKSDNLGIIPDYSELFKKHIKKVEPDYINKISENFEFSLVKETGEWKIDEINDRNVFLETLTLNMAEFN